MSNASVAPGNISSMLPVPSKQLKVFLSESANAESISDVEARECQSNKQEFIEHVVDHKKDTLLGLSLKYGVPRTDIVLHNDLPTSGNLSTVNVLKIPLHRAAPVKKQDPPRTLLTEQVKIRTFIKEHGVSEGEARYYLGECNWRYSDAVRMYLHDEEHIPVNDRETSSYAKGERYTSDTGHESDEETTTLLPEKASSSSKKERSTSTLRQRKVRH